MCHSGRALNLRQILQIFGDVFENFIAMVSMKHLASAEEHRELDFMTFFQEFSPVFELDFQIAFVGFWSEPNFLEGSGMTGVFLVGFASLSLLLIEPLAVIHDPTNRRIARWGHFHEIQFNLTCPGHRLMRFDDSYLIILMIDQADYSGLNPSIYL
jgi:hypothetical protein